MIPAFVALPLAVAFALPLIARRYARAGEAAAGATALVLLGLAVLSLGQESIYHMGGWPTPVGIDLRLDGLASLMLLAINGVTAAVCLYSVEYMRGRGSGYDYYALLLLLAAGANGAVLAGDLFNLYVFMELGVVASYALVALGSGDEALEASFKYAVLGTLSSTLVLIGIAIVYGVTGTLNMADVASRIAPAGPDGALGLAAALMIAGFSLKAGLVPFHAWLPDAYPSAPAPVSAVLAGVISKAIGVYVLARLLYNVLGASADLLTVLRWLGAISMVVGGLLATAQGDLKRLLAYSSVSQAGYMVLGLGLGTPLGVMGALFHLLNHAVFKTLLFLNAGAVEHATGTRDLERLARHGAAPPVARATSLVASMSIAGLPPFNGFWSKLLIIVACVEGGFAGFGVLAALVSVVTLAYQLRLQRSVFFAETSAAAAAREPRLMAAVMIVLAIGCGALSLLVLGGFETPMLIAPAQAVLVAGPFGL
ncbi:MAG: complex I subunit 5 family protein [Gammaproteobacteria bacterium]